MGRASRNRFLLRAALLLPVTLGLWHWLQVPVISALCVMADAIWPSLFPHGLVWINGSGSTAWTIHTGWPLAQSAEQKMTVQIDTVPLRRIVGGFPLLVVLCLASPGTHGRRLAGSAALLLGICWLAVSFYAWHTLAIASGTQASVFDERWQPPPFALAVSAYPAWQVYASGYLAYLATLVIPFVAPLVLWAWLYRGFVRRLVVGAQRSLRR
jgi:hypothetical protein